MKITEKQKQNAKTLVSHLEVSKLPIPLQIGVMCVIGKESSFKLRRERSYRNTSNERLRKLFSRVRNLSDSRLSELKKNDIMFFDQIYGGKLGNRNGTTDGFDSRGAGFNQITGRTMHKKYGDLMNPENASLACVEYFEKRLVSTRIAQRYGDSNCWNDDDGILIAANMNAGLGYGKSHAVVQRAFKHALKWYDFSLGIYWGES